MDIFATVATVLVIAVMAVAWGTGLIRAGKWLGSPKERTRLAEERHRDWLARQEEARTQRPDLIPPFQRGVVEAQMTEGSPQELQAERERGAGPRLPDVPSYIPKDKKKRTR